MLTLVWCKGYPSKYRKNKRITLVERESDYKEVICTKDFS